MRRYYKGSPKIRLNQEVKEYISTFLDKIPSQDKKKQLENIKNHSLEMLKVDPENSFFKNLFSHIEKSKYYLLSSERKRKRED